MIVITTYNGKFHLERLLNELNNLDLLGHKILVVDSGTNDSESINYLNYLKENNSNFNYELLLDKTSNSNYDSGVIIHAMKNYNEEYYIFIHDSFSIKNNECLVELNRLMDVENSVVPFLTFGGNEYDNKNQINFCSTHYGTGDNKCGIFASIFGISNKSVSKIDLNSLVGPSNKDESRAMERCWSVIFEKSGLNIIPFEGEFDYAKIINDEYVYFRKYFGDRQ